MDTVNAQSSWVEAEFDIDFHRLRDLYCPDGGTYIASVTTEIEEVLKSCGHYWIFLFRWQSHK